MTDRTAAAREAGDGGSARTATAGASTGGLVRTGVARRLAGVLAAAVLAGCAAPPAATGPAAATPAGAPVAASPGAAATAATPLPPALAGTLVVQIDDGPPRRFGLDDLRALPVVDAVAPRRDGGTLPVRGVPVTALLKAAGLDLAADLGGGTVSSRALVAVGADGYRAVFGLAELDPRFARPPVLATTTQADGSPLAPNAGPIQLLAPGDPRTSRWVRQLTHLRVVVPR